MQALVDNKASIISDPMPAMAKTNSSPNNTESINTSSPIKSEIDPNLHNNEEETETTTKAKPLDDVMKTIVTGANGFNVVATGLSALVRLLNYQKTKDKVTFWDHLAAFAVKGGMGINSAFNIYNGAKQKNICDTLGFVGELLIASAVPYKFVNLLRGITFCIYQTPSFLTSPILGGEIPENKTWAEDLKVISERLPLAFKKLFSPELYKLSNLNKSAGLLTGMWGGILSLVGVGYWALTGDMRIGGAVKGIGEWFVDFFQVIPKEHWECKRKFYIGSGVSFIFGTFSDIVSNWFKKEPVTRDLCFFFVSIGRLLMTKSKVNREHMYGPGGVIRHHDNNEKPETKAIPSTAPAAQASVKEQIHAATPKLVSA